MTSETEQIVERLEALAGRRGGTARARPARGRDLLLCLADGASPGVPAPEDAVRPLHGILSAVKRKAISEAFAARLLERLVPKAAAPRRRPTVVLDIPAVADAASYAEAQWVVLRAAAAGRLTPAEAKTMGGVLAETWRAVRTAKRQRRWAA